MIITLIICATIIILAVMGYIDDWAVRRYEQRHDIHTWREPR